MIITVVIVHYWNIQIQFFID